MPLSQETSKITENVKHIGWFWLQSKQENVFFLIHVGLVLLWQWLLGHRTATS